MRDELKELLDAQRFESQFDFLYVPMNLAEKINFGYAFVNFLTPEVADDARKHFHGFTDWPISSEKPCEVQNGTAVHGRDAHVERYRNSPLMHESVPDEFRPAIYNGSERVAFPPPTRSIKAPRIKARKKKKKSGDNGEHGLDGNDENDDNDDIDDNDELGEEP